MVNGSEMSKGVEHHQTLTVTGISGVVNGSEMSEGVELVLVKFTTHGKPPFP